jgi:SulP family sulfate permease
MDHHNWDVSDKEPVLRKTTELHRIIISGDSEQAKRFDLPLGMTFIGRNPNNDLVLKDPQVSWHHARITVLGDTCILEDLESTNGTFVDNRRVTYQELSNDNLISIGPYRLQYERASIVLSPVTASENTLLSATYRRDAKITDDVTLPLSNPSRSLEPTGIDQWRIFVARFRPSSISNIFPLLSSIRSYNRDYLRGDLVAGITVAAMLIPQGMAYAMLAGLPPIMGLYASMLPMLLYALVGTSRQMSVGPVALDSILVAVGIGTLAQAGTGSYIALAILLAAFIGILQLLMGISRLGFLVNFLSYPVLVGFTSAAAIITALSQMSHVFGIAVPGGFELSVLFETLLEHYVDINLFTLALSIGAILALIGLKQWLPHLPGPLFVVVVCTLLVWLLALDEQKVKIVGNIPAGLPTLTLPVFDWDTIRILIPLAATMALVGFAQSISVAKSFAQKNNYHIEPNKELIGIGLANIGASLSQGYPVTGGFSRSAVNARAGAKTPFASIITALVIGVTLLLFTPTVYFLPNAALAAIVLVSAVGLIDSKEIRYLFAVKKSEGVLLTFTFLGTLVFGVIYGLLLGVIASILLFIILNTRPHAVILGRLPDTNIFRNIVDFPEGQRIPGLVILRIDASLYFANTEFLKSKLREIREQNGTSLQAIILDASAVNDLDSSADTALHQIVADYQKHGIEFFIAGVKGPVRRVMKRSGLYDVLGGDHFFFTIEAAVNRYQRTKE